MAIKEVNVNGVGYQIDYRYLANKPISKTSVTLTTSWLGDGPYTQVVSISGTTANTKVDLQPDAAALGQMLSDGVMALWIENDNGTLTAKALGAAPSEQLTLQCVLTEVA